MYSKFFLKFSKLEVSTLNLKIIDFIFLLIFIKSMFIFEFLNFKLNLSIL